MKKLSLVLVFVITFVLAGCTVNEDGTINLDISGLSSDQSLATLTYLSGSFLQTSTTDTTMNSGLTFLTTTTEEETETTEVESELDDVNVYLDKLKVFMDGGVDTFANITQQVSDREGYLFMMDITAGDEEMLLYYNIDLETNDITGLLVIGEVEYTVTAENDLEDADELDDDDDDDDDDVDGEESDDDEEEEDANSSITKTTVDQETEQKMVLIAVNGDDVITITYKVETSVDETETKFEVERLIDGVESYLELKISEELDEFKVEIEEEDSYYEFKREIESENETVYKLEYEVNGVEGEIKVTETVNELGETVYTYEIEEEGKEAKTVEKEDPDDDDDEEEQEQEESETA